MNLGIQRHVIKIKLPLQIVLAAAEGLVLLPTGLVERANSWSAAPSPHNSFFL